MTLDGIITLLTLLVAIYALLPRVSRLRVRLGIELQILLAIVAFLLILSIQFNRQINYVCTTTLSLRCEWLSSLNSNLFTPPELSFIITLVWIGLACAVYKTVSRLRVSSLLPVISKIVDNLIYEQRYAELIELIDPWLPKINQASRRSLRLQKIHDRIRSMRRQHFTDLTIDKEIQYVSRHMRLSKTFVRKLYYYIGSLSITVPRQRRYETIAGDIERAICQSKDLRNYVIKVQPYFALSLFPLREVKEFSDGYLTGLVSDTNSKLYEEFRWNAKFPPGIQPREGNQILGALFNDAQVAKRLAIWGPIARYMLALMRTRESPDPEFTASLNSKSHDFDLERWSNPIHGGIYLFDVMVTAAALQGIKWHMWLYYCSYFIEELENTYDTSDPEINESDEFPTRSARLIYEVISVLRNWILLVEKLPPDSPHMKSNIFDLLSHIGDDQTYQDFYDNGNIPVSATNVLGLCLKNIVLSKRIDDKFKGYIYKIAVDITRKIDDPWHTLLIRCIVRGGSGMLNAKYGSALFELHSQIDYFDRREFYSDVTEAFKIIYGID